jgi:hypothetical protein
LYISQFWTRFQVVNYRESMDTYNNHTSLLREEDISYGVDGVLRRDPLEYEFPTTRRKDKLSVMQQCHSIMRSKTFSSPISEYSSSMDETRKIVTLEAILAHVQSDNEWKPLNKFGNSTNKDSREAIIEAIRSYKDNDFALSVLYDNRFVSRDSQFCPSTTPHTSPTQKNISLDALWDAIYGTETDQEEILEDKKSIPQHVMEFGLNERTLGSIDTICPCPYYNDLSGKSTTNECNIDVVFCSLQSFVDDSPLFKQCNVNTGSYITYSLDFIQEVRDLLVEHSDFLYENKLECHHMLPSDLWGIRSQYGSDGIDAIMMSMYSKSGVTLGNLKHVNDTFKTLLGEGNRTVHLKSSGDTQVKNVLCGEQWSSHSTIARLGFPVLSLLAESPAVVNCLRYIMEISWIDILNKYEPLLAGSDVSVREMHANAQTTAGIWHRRCRVKLTKLRTCHEQGAYNPSIINNVDTRTDNVEYCPFELSRMIDTTKTALMPGPCLIIHGSKLYDPHLCKQQETVVNDVSVFDIHNLLEECTVFNPMDMLSSNSALMHGVVDLPDLRQRFVYDIIGYNMSGPSTYTSRTAGLSFNSPVYIFRVV